MLRKSGKWHDFNDDDDAQPSVTERVRSSQLLANFGALQCSNGHEVTKHKQGQRWHQGWTGTKTCDLCKKKLRRSEGCWRCEHHCDFNVCEDCYDKRPEKELVKEALWKATQAQNLTAIEEALEQAAAKEVSQDVHALHAAMRARQRLLRTRLQEASSQTSRVTLEELRSLLEKVREADIGGWRHEVQQARARMEKLERLEKQQVAKKALQAATAAAAATRSRPFQSEFSVDINSISTALEQAKEADVPLHCDEAVAANLERQELVKCWLLIVEEEWEFQRVLQEARAAGLDELNSPAVRKAQEARRNFAKAALRTAIANGEVPQIDEALARARAAGFAVGLEDVGRWNEDDAELAAVIEAARRKKQQIAKDALVAATGAGDRPDFWDAVDAALAKVRAEGVADNCAEVLAAKAAKEEKARAMLREATASELYGKLEEALQKACVVAGLSDTCEEVRAAKAKQARPLVYHELGPHSFRVAETWYRSTPSSSMLKLQKAFTVMVWVHPLRRTTDWVRVLGKGTSGPRNYGLWIQGNTGQVLSQVYGPQEGGSLHAPAQHAVPLNAWTHLAMRFAQDGEHELYINGRQIMHARTKGVPSTSDDPVTLGKAQMHQGFVGNLKDARVYSFAMEAEDIQNIISPALKVDPVALLLSVPLDAPLPLAIKVQEAVDKDVVRGLVKPRDLPRELHLEQEFQSVRGGVDCFHCLGAGFLVPGRRGGSLLEALGFSNNVVESNAPPEEVPPTPAAIAAALPIWVVEASPEAQPKLSPMGSRAPSKPEYEIYPKDVAKKLEEAFLHDGDGAMVRICSELSPESTISWINLSTMMQTDVDTTGVSQQRAVYRLIKSELDEAAEHAGDGSMLVDAMLSADDSSQSGTWLFDNGAGGWGLFDERSAIALECVMSLSEVATVMLRGPSFWYRVDLASMTQTNTNTGMTRRIHRVSGSSTLPLSDMAADASPPTAKKGDILCWVCRGTGKTSKWLSSAEVRCDEEERPCLICYCDSMYGMSVDCDHFYCDDCIRGSLNAMLDAGQFPAFCPQCRADAGKDPTQGRVTPPVLTFLEQREIITKEFQFRFITADRRALREHAEEYFECPASCGNFLIAQEASWIMVDGKPQLRLGECQCGALVCLRCKKQQEPGKKHECEAEPEKPVVDPAERKREEEAFAAMAAIGKKCPVCGQFIQKNEGCEWMLCGTAAHGKLAEALRNGGCGIAFNWNSLAVADDPCGWHDLDGGHKRGRPVTARQLKEHPKCKRPDCPFFKTVDGLGPGVQAPSGLQNFHTAVGTQARTNGGEYCCDQCGKDGTHSNVCHKIRHDEKKMGDPPDRDAIKAKSVTDLEVAPTKLLQPFEGRHIRLTWPRQRHDMGLADGRSFHAQFLGENRLPLIAQAIKFTTEKPWWSKPATELNFGKEGLVGSNWQVSCDMGSNRVILGIKTDAGSDLPFTIHYSVDDMNWVPYTGLAEAAGPAVIKRSAAPAIATPAPAAPAAAVGPEAGYPKAAPAPAVPAAPEPVADPAPVVQDRADSAPAIGPRRAADARVKGDVPLLPEQERRIAEFVTEFRGGYEAARGKDPQVRAGLFEQWQFFEMEFGMDIPVLLHGAKRLCEDSRFGAALEAARDDLAFLRDTGGIIFRLHAMWKDGELETMAAVHGDRLEATFNRIVNPLEGERPISIDGHHLGALYNQVVGAYLSSWHNDSSEATLTASVRRVGEAAVNMYRRHGCNGGVKSAFIGVMRREYLDALHGPVWGSKEADVVWRTFYA